MNSVSPKNRDLSVSRWLYFTQPRPIIINLFSASISPCKFFAYFRFQGHLFFFAARAWDSLFTYSLSKYVRLANVPSGRDVIAFVFISLKINNAMSKIIIINNLINWTFSSHFVFYENPQLKCLQCIVLFTYKSVKYVRWVNTSSGRDVMTFEDKALRNYMMQGMLARSLSGRNSISFCLKINISEMATRKNRHFF